MTCNTRENTLKELVRLKAISEERIVLNETLLDEKMAIYTNTAKQKYGVFQDEPVYTIEETVKQRKERRGIVPASPSRIIKRLILSTFL